MENIENLNGLFSNALKEYNKGQEQDDWLKRQVKELMNREGYQTLGDSGDKTTFQKENSDKTIKIIWRSEK